MNKKNIGWDCCFSRIVTIPGNAKSAGKMGDNFFRIWQGLNLSW